MCTWCEMHDGRLILIPTQKSKRLAQHVRYPAEATIVGRVTGVTNVTELPLIGETVCPWHSPDVTLRQVLTLPDEVLCAAIPGSMPKCV